MGIKTDDVVLFAIYKLATRNPESEDLLPTGLGDITKTLEASSLNVPNEAIEPACLRLESRGLLECRAAWQGVSRIDLTPAGAQDSLARMNDLRSQ